MPEKVVWQNDRRKISPEIAALQEPFGNAVFATLNQDITGKSVAVLGCGPIGLFSVGIARASGASHVYASDLNETRLALAKAMGATLTFNPRDDHSGEGDSGGGSDMVERLVAANNGLGVDVVLEMSGSPIAINTAFRAARNGGTVVLFGIPSDPVEIDIAENMIFKNLQVTALNGRRIFETWYKTRWLLANGVVDLNPLITRSISFEQVDEFMPMLESGDACKLVLKPRHRAPVDVERREARRESEDQPIQGTVHHR